MYTHVLLVVHDVYMYIRSSYTSITCMVWYGMLLIYTNMYKIEQVLVSIPR